jgi:DNA-nicking Smr family endonuclease
MNRTSKQPAKSAPEAHSGAQTGSEAELFRSTVGDVTPLRQGGRVLHDLARPHPLPLQTWRDEQAALRESLAGIPPDSDLETGEELSFVRHGIGAHVLRKLRRGHWIIQDELDLHGFNSADARELLGEFLAQCTRKGLRCVRIVHGKGLRSKNRQPVLKSKVAVWLMRRDEILAYCQARPTEGGSGTVVVLLKG